MKSSLGRGHWKSVLEQQRVSAARSGAAASRFLGAAPARVVLRLHGVPQLSNRIGMTAPRLSL